MEEKKHGIVLDDRKRMNITMCEEVISFNENLIMLNAGGNALVIKGTGLRVEEVSKTTGDAVICGEEIESVVYTKRAGRNKESFIRRILR